MEKLWTVDRILMGLIFFVFGLNGFIGFMPIPPMTGKALEFMSALMNSGYLMTLVKATEVLAGFMLLTGCYVPFALLLLAPITLNIFLFHLFLLPSGLIMAVLILALHLALAYHYWDSYKHFFKGKSSESES